MNSSESEQGPAQEVATTLSSENKEKLAARRQEAKLSDSKNNEYEKLNERSRERLTGEYLGFNRDFFVLFDLVKYENKKQMVEGLTKLFQSGQQGQRGWVLPDLPDIKESGMLSGGGYATIGLLINSKKQTPNANSFYPNAVYVDLPDCIESVEIRVFQLYGFCYFLTYFSKLSKGYHIDEWKKRFIESSDMITGDKPGHMFRRGPDQEPEISGCEEELRKFLSPYSSGLYMSIEKTCPSVRCFSTSQSLQGVNLGQWIHYNFRYLRFMSLQGPFGHYSKGIVTFQADRIFGEAGFPRGHNFLYSTVDTPDYDHDFDFVLEGSLIEFLAPIYWTIWQINELESSQSELDKTTATALLPSQSKKLLQEARTKNDEALRFSQPFLKFYHAEQKNVADIRFRASTWGKHFLKMADIAPSGTDIMEVNFFKEMETVLDFYPKREISRFTEIRSQLDSLIGYYRDSVNSIVGFANIDLQNRVLTLTIVAVVFALIALLTSQNALSYLSGVFHSDPTFFAYSVGAIILITILLLVARNYGRSRGLYVTNPQGVGKSIRHDILIVAVYALLGLATAYIVGLVILYELLHDTRAYFVWYTIVVGLSSYVIADFIDSGFENFAKKSRRFRFSIFFAGMFAVLIVGLVWQAYFVHYAVSSSIFGWFAFSSGGVLGTLIILDLYLKDRKIR